MLLAYGDESFDATQNRICAVASVVGPEELWATLERKWILRTGNVPFHATDCETDNADYAPRNGDDKNEVHKRNKDLYRDLATMLAESGLFGFASAYDLASQRQAFPDPYDPPVYYQPFMSVIEKMKHFAEWHQQTIKLTFDSRLESEPNAALLYAQLREDNPGWKDRLADEISFVCSQDNPRIQIADLFAYEALKHAEREFGISIRGPRRSWLAIKETRRFAIQTLGADFWAAISQLPDPHELLEFSDEDFQKWLDDTRRQRSLTNYFEFLRWHLKQMTTEQRARVNAKMPRWV